MARERKPVNPATPMGSGSSTYTGTHVAGYPPVPAGATQETGLTKEQYRQAAVLLQRIQATDPGEVFQDLDTLCAVAVKAKHVIDLLGPIIMQMLKQYIDEQLDNPSQIMETTDGRGGASTAPTDGRPKLRTGPDARGRAPAPSDAAQDTNYTDDEYQQAVTYFDQIAAEIAEDVWTDAAIRRDFILKIKPAVDALGPKIIRMFKQYARERIAGLQTKETTDAAGTGTAPTVTAGGGPEPHAGPDATGHPPVPGDAAQDAGFTEEQYEQMVPLLDQMAEKAQLDVKSLETIKQFGRTMKPIAATLGPSTTNMVKRYVKELIEGKQQPKETTDATGTGTAPTVTAGGGPEPHAGPDATGHPPVPGDAAQDRWGRA